MRWCELHPDLGSEVVKWWMLAQLDWWVNQDQHEILTSHQPHDYVHLLKPSQQDASKCASAACHDISMIPSCMHYSCRRWKQRCSRSRICMKLKHPSRDEHVYSEKLLSTNLENSIATWSWNHRDFTTFYRHRSRSDETETASLTWLGLCTSFIKVVDPVPSIVYTLRIEAPNGDNSLVSWWL